MKEQGADSISRYKHKSTFYDSESLEEVNLLEKLKRIGSLDTTPEIKVQNCGLSLYRFPMKLQTLGE